MGDMEITQAVEKYFPDTPFTASGLLKRMPRNEWPDMAQFAEASGGSAVRSLGRALASCPGLIQVGKRAHAIVWKLEVTQ